MTYFYVFLQTQIFPLGGEWPTVKRERGHVTAETGVAEVGVFRALQPNVRYS